MNILVVGYGSIGARHARLARHLGHTVMCVSKNPACPFPAMDSIEGACARWRPQKVIVANRTADHGPSLAALFNAGYAGDVLVEKPLFGGATEPAITSGVRIFVAYNLRFHPIIRRLKQAIGLSRLFSANLYAGQYLPDWRPDADYRHSYSARRDLGGGVLRDLSHEIDLVGWLCGPTEKVAAVGGHFSDLDIASDDVFSLLLKVRRCPAVTVSLNYLDRTARRTIAINGEDFSAFADLVNGTLEVNGRVTVMRIERDETYLAQLAAFVEGDPSTLCGVADGRQTDRILAAAERAAAAESWELIS